MVGRNNEVVRENTTRTNVLLLWEPIPYFVVSIIVCNSIFSHLRFKWPATSAAAAATDRVIKWRYSNLPTSMSLLPNDCEMYVFTSGENSPSTGGHDHSVSSHTIKSLPYSKLLPLFFHIVVGCIHFIRKSHHLLHASIYDQKNT